MSRTEQLIITKMCHVCQEQTLSVYQAKHVINQDKLRNSDTHGYMALAKHFQWLNEGLQFTILLPSPSASHSRILSRTEQEQLSLQ